jgi:hypothetical protein
MGYHVDRVNHSEIYSDHGKHTNMAESFFSRLRNMVGGQHHKVGGQHHKVSPQYLHQYANRAAWLEDNHRTDSGTLAHLERLLAAGGLRRNKSHIANCRGIFSFSYVLKLGAGGGA